MASLHAVGGIAKRTGKQSVGWMLTPIEGGFELTLNYYPQFQTTIRVERLEGLTLDEAKAYALRRVEEILDERA